MIKQSDARFPKVFDSWVTEIVVELAQKDIVSSWPETFAFVISKQESNPKDTLVSDIKKMLKVAEKSRFDMLWVGYDHDFLSYDDLLLYIHLINKRRRRKDYQLYASTSFAITNQIQIGMLDAPIPELNIVALNYSGSRSITYG
jgi:predicted aconitase